MKRILIITMVLCGLLTFAGSSWAITAGTTDVGSLDTFVAKTDLSNSNPVTELNWINSVLGSSYTTYSQDSTMNWLSTDTSGVFAFSLSDTPDYFLIKTGKISQTDPNTDFLFKNNVSLAWAVIYLGDLGLTDITNVEKISHVGEVGTGTTQVPEPGMLLMFGSGLVCLGFFGRKKFRK